MADESIETEDSACFMSSRKATQDSQEELGMRANLDRTYISGVERGVRNPSITAIANLASDLGTTVSNLRENLEIEAENVE